MKVAQPCGKLGSEFFRLTVFVNGKEQDSSACRAARGFRSRADLITFLYARSTPRRTFPFSIPAYHPAMTPATVNGTLFLFLFRCEKCHKPITAWSRTPKPGTLEEAEKHVLPLHCVKECGWSSTKMGSEALASWAVPWHYETEL
jgi:hypothetical protein